MANTSSRTLRLLSLLQTHRFWPGGQLAGRLGVSPRTLRRDVDRLRELGYPVRAQRGAEGGYQLEAGAVLPPLVVDDEEAVALAVGLQAAAQSPIEGVAESSVRALAKVVQVMPRNLRRRVESLRTMTTPAVWGRPGPAVDPDVLTAAAQACRDTERLTFRYVSLAGERTEREVEPFRVVSSGRRWYLVAYDLTRHDWRSFRLDRIDEPRATGTRFRPREFPAADAAAFVTGAIDRLKSTYAVEVVVHAPAAEVRERYGAWASIEPEGDGHCRLRMTTDTFDWPALVLGGVGADFDVVGPPELGAHLRDWAERFARATR